ncbi:MAG TPA: hypothetical protein VGQ36_01365 [Thermoanaerobaculia bacterium]|jgi:hypothetical protein|nr:hypothetical protein [Thermoanaerobaculia bacterium]
MKIRWALVFLIALVVMPAYAADEMRKLDWLVGEWKGEAVVLSGPEKGENALQSERVQSRQGGKILVVEGLGKRKLADGTAGDVVHDAFGVIWYDEQAKKYRFHSWTTRTGYVDSWFEVSDDGSVRWGFDISQGKIRFTIKRTEKGDWHEVGEYSPDGTRWFQTLEMKLQKK